MNLSVINFINELKLFNAGDVVFNPWNEYTDQYDIGPCAPKIRSLHLQRFLEPRVKNANYLFVAEALGYQGGRFSGIPLTSERIITGNHSVINYSNIFDGEVGTRTSNPLCDQLKKAQRIRGFSEQTSTIVWKAIIDHNINPYNVVMWNIFPFHPFVESDGLLSNRTPSSNEFELGFYYFQKLLSLCPKNIQIICIGRHSKKIMDRHGVDNQHLIHPSKGGAQNFKDGFTSLFS